MPQFGPAAVRAVVTAAAVAAPALLTWMRLVIGRDLLCCGGQMRRTRRTARWARSPSLSRWWSDGRWVAPTAGPTEGRRARGSATAEMTGKGGRRMMAVGVARFGAGGVRGAAGLCERVCPRECQQRCCTFIFSQQSDKVHKEPEPEPASISPSKNPNPSVANRYMANARHAAQHPHAVDMPLS